MFMNMKLIHSYKYTEYATKLHLKPMRLMNETKVIKQIPVGLTIRARITMMGINSTNISKTNNNLPSQLNSLHTKKTMTYCNKLAWSRILLRVFIYIFLWIDTTLALPNKQQENAAFVYIPWSFLVHF